jgi:hypothetical protein
MSGPRDFTSATLSTALMHAAAAAGALGGRLSRNRFKPFVSHSLRSQANLIREETLSDRRRQINVRREALEL